MTYTYAPVTKVADELRVETESDAGVTRHFWEATEVRRPIRGTRADSGRANIVWETDDVGFVEATYTVHPQPYGQLISQRRDGDSSFYHFDGAGSTRLLTDATQTTTDSYIYRAFGQIQVQSGTTVNPFQWIGELGYYRDEDTGLYSLRRRDYEPGTSRFTSEDPLGQSLIEPNLYRYALNAPTTYSDPSGLQATPVQDAKLNGDIQPSRPNGANEPPAEAASTPHHSDAERQSIEQELASQLFNSQNIQNERLVANLAQHLKSLQPLLQERNRGFNAGGDPPVPVATEAPEGVRQLRAEYLRGYEQALRSVAEGLDADPSLDVTFDVLYAQSQTPDVLAELDAARPRSAREELLGLLTRAPETAVPPALQHTQFTLRDLVLAEIDESLRLLFLAPVPAPQTIGYFDHHITVDLRTGEVLNYTRDTPKKRETQADNDEATGLYNATHQQIHNPIERVVFDPRTNTLKGGNPNLHLSLQQQQQRDGVWSHIPGVMNSSGAGAYRPTDSEIEAEIGKARFDRLGGQTPEVDLLLGAAEFAAGFVPGIGELQDLQVLFSKAPWWAKGLAGVSLLASAVSAGLLPNFGSVFRAGRRMSRADVVASARYVTNGPTGAMFDSAKPLTGSQRSLLRNLQSAGTEVVVGKKVVSMNDLRNLTLHTGDEFAMLTRRGERMIIRGDGGAILTLNVDRAAELSAQGWRFSGHTHTPGFQAVGSPGDKNVLRAFSQRQSAVWGAEWGSQPGRFFGQFADEINFNMGLYK